MPKHLFICCVVIPAALSIHHVFISREPGTKLFMNGKDRQEANKLFLMKDRETILLHHTSPYSMYIKIRLLLDISMFFQCSLLHPLSMLCEDRLLPSASTYSTVVTKAPQKSI